MNTHRVGGQRKGARVLVALCMVAASAVAAVVVPSTAGAAPPPVLADAASTPYVTAAGHPHVGPAEFAKLAQTFTAGRTGTLRVVNLRLAKHAPPDAPDQDLLVEITELKANGTPGDVVASALVPRASVAEAPATVDLDVAFADAGVVFENRQYAVVLSTASTTGKYAWYGGSYGAGVDLSNTGGTWSDLTGGDGTSDRSFAVSVQPGFVDTLFGTEMVDGDGSGNDNPYNLQINGAGSVYAGWDTDYPKTVATLDMGVNGVAGHLRSPASIRSRLNLQASSVWSGGNVLLGSYSHVRNDLFACGNPGDVFLDHNQRVDGEVRYRGSLSTTDGSAPFGWSIGTTTKASCAAPVEESLPTWSLAGNYAGWTVLTFASPVTASRCLNERTAARCNGVAPSSTPGALGFPGPGQSTGLLIRVLGSSCGSNRVLIGPGEIRIAGNVHIVSGCRVRTRTYTSFTQVSGAPASQLVIASLAAGGNDSIDVQEHFATNGPTLSTLFYTPGHFRNRGTMTLAGGNGGGGGIYARLIHLYGSVQITRSQHLVNEAPTGFSFPL